MLSPEQIEQYRKDGYVKVEGVLDSAQLDAARATVDALIEGSRGQVASDGVLALGPAHTAEAPHVRRIKNPPVADPVFDRIMRSAAVLDPIRQLIGNDIRYQGGKLNMKMAGAGDPIAWHQDFAFYPYTNDDLLAVGIAIDDADLDNGCLMVIPGSHRGPILDHNQAGAFLGAVRPDHPDLHAERAVPIELRAGDMSIHHVRMFHSSAPNTSGRTRRLLLLQYAATDAYPIAYQWTGLPGPAIAGDNADIVSGVASPVARSIPLSYPVPKYVGGQDTIYEIQETLVASSVAG